MLSQLNLGEILFLDIETVPQAAGFELLDEDWKALWTEKSKFMREKQQIDLPTSYESAGIYAEFGKIIVIGVGYLTSQYREKVFRTKVFAGHDEKELLSEFAAMLERLTNDPFRLLCAHNGKEFDFPYLCRRMLVNGIRLPQLLNIAGRKPWEVAHLDTMELWKFGDYKHYTSLRLLAQMFDIPTPKDDIDGSRVREVYWQDNDLERIQRYCVKDVVTVARLLARFTGVNDFPDDGEEAGA
ncbi:MAG: 3'-5' exonuclease [Flavobacteriales bacterium]|nr:3'-5' exonuclease [Flavobacteriales bacterium]